jgi:hypothetical protein
MPDKAKQATAAKIDKKVSGIFSHPFQAFTDQNLF